MPKYQHAAGKGEYGVLISINLINKRINHREYCYPKIKA